MKMLHQKSQKTDQSFQRVIWKRLALCASLLPFLSGCGSGDDFPGTSDNQAPDPLITDIPMFYIERPLRMEEDDPTATEPDNLKDPITFHGNAHLYMKIRAAQSVPSIDLSARAVPGNVDVRDLDVSADGKFVLFSLRPPQIEGTDEDEQPAWRIWEYDIQNDSLSQIAPPGGDTAISGHDITPRYLSNTNPRRIIFASTRQTRSRAILTDEAKGAGQFSHLEESRRQKALNLHAINVDGTEYTQLTFNQSHDFYPALMANGKVVYSRWDQFDGEDQGINLYEMNPDGTDNHLLYGRHSHMTGSNASALEFIRGNLMPDGDLFVLARPTNTTYYGGDFLRIDASRYIDNTRPVNGTSGSGPAQTTVTNKQILTDGTSISPGGYFSAFFPMWDNTDRALVSWSQCRVALNGNTLPCTQQNLSATGAESAPPAYGLWIYNYTDNTQIPVVIAQEGIVYTDVALGAPRTEPPRRPDNLGNSTLRSDEEAAIHIRNVYDFDGTAGSFGGTAAAYLRIMKAVSEPPRTEDGAIHSINDNNGRRMREVVGYAPIESDGSVKTRVPANVALTLSIVDAEGKELFYNGSTRLRHRNWITLRPGEEMECNGCHTPNSTAPHGRQDAQAPSITPGNTIAQPTIVELSTDLLYGGPSYPLPAGLTDPSDRICLLPWSSGCPVIINYEDHIQPIWELDRGALDTPILATNPAHDNDNNPATPPPPATCTGCHNSQNAMGALQVPAGQLELTNQADNPDSVQIRSYVELFNADIEQLLVGQLPGEIALVDCTQVEQQVDDNGDTIDVTVPCPATEGPYLNTGGARSSLNRDFFALFETAPTTGSHAGYLTPAELRLIAEWLDIGAQYYNNHFDAPDN